MRYIIGLLLGLVLISGASAQDNTHCVVNGNTVDCRTTPAQPSVPQTAITGQMLQGIQMANQEQAADMQFAQLRAQAKASCKALGTDYKWSDWTNKCSHKAPKPKKS